MIWPRQIIATWSGRLVDGSLARPGRYLFTLTSHSSRGTARPVDSYATVQYRGYWFWIDHRDLVSKRTFSFLQGLFNFADTGKPENLPLVTIPAQ